MFHPTFQLRKDVEPVQRFHDLPCPRSSQPLPSRAIPITSQPVDIPPANASIAPSKQSKQELEDLNIAHRQTVQRSAWGSLSGSSESSFGSVSHYYPHHTAPPEEIRPRLAAPGTAPSSDQLGPSTASPFWALRDPPPHRDRPSHPPSHISRPPALRPQSSLNPPPTTWRHQPIHAASLPDLRHIRPHAPDVVAALRRLEDNSTKPFSLDPPPFSDRDVPLPQPYNAAYPHPLTAYASPGVNSSCIRAVGWRETLKEMMKTDLNFVKGTILAASDRNINPPALMIPVFEGEGCGIPERLWSRFESMGEGLSSALATATASSSSLPPRFAQTGLQVVSTPGGRSGPGADSFSSLSAEGFPTVRTNFSNVLRRTSEADTGRAAVPARRSAPQPTPFHKTELCRTWEHEGSCKYGLNCQFAHGRLELRMPVTGMPTPPSTYRALSSRHDDCIPPVAERGIRSASTDRQSLHNSIGLLGEQDSPPLSPFHRHRSTSFPIDTERLQSTAERAVPVPGSKDPSAVQPPCSFAEYNYPPPHIVSSRTHHYGVTIDQQPSISFLSASATSFETIATPSTALSSSNSPTSIFNSSIPHEHLSHPASSIWAKRRESALIVEAADDADVPDWEVLKRSIDATTVRSVWEE